MINSTTIEEADKKLADLFYKNSGYNTLFLTVAGTGFLVIYLLAQFRALGEPTPQLLSISIAVFLLAISQIPIRSMARRGNGITTNYVATAVVSVFGIALVSLWDGTAIIAALVILITPLQAITGGLPRKYYPQIFSLTALGLAGVYYFNANPFLVERLQTNTVAAISSLAFLATTGILLAVTFIVSQSTSFKSIQSQLLTSFSIIIIIPILMTAALSAIGSFSNNQTQSLNTLYAVASLKETQLDNLLDGMQNDAEKLLNDSVFQENVLNFLSPGDFSPSRIENAQRFVRLRMENILGLENEEYVEIMVLNIKGELVISSLPINEGIKFNSQTFYKQGITKPFFAYSSFPSFGSDNVIAARPIYDRDGRAIRGILALRISSDSINKIMSTTLGVEEVETYLVNENLVSLTTLKSPANLVNTQATIEGTQTGFKGKTGTYSNYNGETVLGFYKRYEPLQVVFVTEIPLAVITTNSLSSITGSLIIATVIILIAMTAVVVSARALVEPITSLVNSSKLLAAGELGARATIERQDEIGALGNSYNQMAEQLQDIVGRLEQRVADRTRELENQTLRLRVAADIAKDAASSKDVVELLARASNLIQARFSFYHTGIFMLDNDSRFAVLIASPTEAGKQMIRNGHKLRVGEIGIVGRVASTGEPRITLDTGTDAAYFNNPLLPDTRSEMALPLKINDKVIGVLDIQSTESQAFTDEDVAIMQVLADQLATAVERTRLLQQVEQNLRDLQQSFGQSTLESWRTLAESELLSETGYVFDNIRIQPIKEMSTEAFKAMETGTTLTSKARATGKDTDLVAIPIKIRGQSVGVVTVRLREGYRAKTIQTIEQSIERLAGSLESARLFEEARLRADREQAISRVTSAISAAPEFDAILRTAVEEIGKTLGDSDVKIELVD